MSLVPRPASDPPRLNRPFTRFLHVMGYVFLAGAGIDILGYSEQYPSAQLWPALGPVAITLLFLWLLERERTWLRSAAYLLVGGISTYLVAIMVYALPDEMRTTDAVPITLMKLAVIMIGGASAGVWRTLAWSVVAFAVSEGAAFVAGLQSGGRITVDASTSAAVLALTVVLVLVGLTRKQMSRARPMLDQAARDEEVAAIRYGIEVRAAALMHDTILSHLAAVTHAENGVLRSDFRREVETDLELLLGEEWLSDPSPDIQSQGRSDWRRSALLASVQDMRARTLDVEVTGDLAAVGRLSNERDIAVALAVKQCLMNVLNHAHVLQAEVVILGSGSEVSVMVIDAGSGFSESSVGPDRLGIRQSVRRRIEEVGGTVQIWSTPGRGTSVMIRVPASELVREPQEAADG